MKSVEPESVPCPVATPENFFEMASLKRKVLSNRSRRPLLCTIPVDVRRHILFQFCSGDLLSIAILSNLQIPRDECYVQYVPQHPWLECLTEVGSVLAVLRSVLCAP